ncbi:MAG TPA: SCO family protein [Acidimicrobiales bacterium]|nr:SCO family protein [Acidimicrobiales bacterium]
MEGRSSVAALSVVLVCAALSVFLAACSSDPAAPTALGTVMHRSVPSSVSQITLTDQRARDLDLSSWRGKTVMIVPFLTLCTDICPLDTGNLLQVQRALAADGVARHVQLVELSIDPGRDTPARLAAYATLTGASWELVTESAAAAGRLEQFFGWDVQRVAEDTPPSIDWWTKQPLTYDVNHADGFVLLDRRGDEIFSTAAAPDFHGTLNPTLHGLLNDEGRDHLAHPLHPGWNPAGALGALGWAVGRSLPAAS